MTLTIGERISVLFEIEGHPVDVKAEVIRVDVLGIAADKIAVRFVDVSAGTRALIHDLVLRALEHEEQLLVRGED